METVTKIQLMMMVMMTKIPTFPSMRVKFTSWLLWQQLM